MRDNKVGTQLLGSIKIFKVTYRFLSFPTLLLKLFTKSKKVPELQILGNQLLANQTTQ